ncbi:MAG: hypothetical protein OXJ52_05010, partial [Oligoflexia bacterium]|nr:hypothetical protein [Oligoflexia bacterium]
MSFPYVKSYTVKIKPKGSYILNQNDVVYKKDKDHNFILDENGNKIILFRRQPPTAFLLSNISQAVDILYLSSSGDYKYELDRYAPGGTGREASGLLGLFSNSNNPPNFFIYGNESDSNINASYTSQPDFNIGSHCVKVQRPAGADRILFSPPDTFNSDNSDDDGDYKAHIHEFHKGANIGYSNPVQVVTAPQLERDENTGLTHHYQSSYDLVANKPFMVRTGFHQLYPNTDSPNYTNTKFNLVFKVQKKNKEGKYVDMKIGYTCPGANNTESKANCLLKGSDFHALKAPQTEADGTKYY